MIEGRVKGIGILRSKGESGEMKTRGRWGLKYLVISCHVSQRNFVLINVIGFIYIYCYNLI